MVIMAFRYAVETRNTTPAWFQRFVYPLSNDGDSGLSNNTTYKQIAVTTEREINERLHRWNGSTDPAACVRSATPDEVAAYDALKVAAVAARDSLSPDVLAMLGVIVRGRNVSAWNAMSPALKKQAVKDEAAVWTQMREFFDKGVV